MDRFDMEQQILKVWSVADDIEELAEYILDGETPMTHDDIFNVLYGLSRMLDIKCEKLFNGFEQALKVKARLEDVAKMAPTGAKMETLKLNKETVVERLKRIQETTPDFPTTNTRSV